MPNRSDDVARSHTLNVPAFDPLAWAAIAFRMVKASREGDVRALVSAGVVAGVALEVKYAMLFRMIGLVLTPARRLLMRPAF